MIYIIDASVASRFLLIEDLSEKAKLVLESFIKGNCELKAPKLIVYQNNVEYSKVHLKQ